VSGSLSSVHFQTADGLTFSHLHGPVTVDRIVASSRGTDGLSITVQSAADPTDKNTFLFTLKDNDHASLRLQGIPIPPFAFVRASGAAVVATDWDESKTYSADEDAVSNAGMKEIFDEDQRARSDGFTKIDWKVVARADAERREATRKLLQADSLHTADDFIWAAHVFQHGDTPDDYLLAHTLAMVAAKKGSANAIWIACATLDRYLQSIGKPQIYGTQFLTPDGKPATQDPYNRTLISDSLRRQLGVPVQAQQEDQRKEYDTEREKHASETKTVPPAK
jgi:hypothetical protein